jgi:gas vesicle protein
MAKSFNNVLLAVAGGLAAGIVIGMLIAPDKGSKTRKKLRKKMAELAEEAGIGLEEKIRPLSEVFRKEEKTGSETTPE